MNDHFDLHRFARVLINDLMQLQLRRIAFASLGLAGLGFLVYLANVSSGPEAEDLPIAYAQFSALLFLGGAIFTSMIFNDMHHPLERYHYLMLPCSNLERFASRYLISAPLYVLYAIVLYKVFEVGANFLCALLREGRVVAPLDLRSSMLWDLVKGYFILHVFVYTGAIWFRSNALIKTMFTGFVIWGLFGALLFLSIRLMYWDAFISMFDTNPEGPYINFEFIAAGLDDGPLWYHKLLGGALLLWVLFLAWLGLKEHEVQGGL
ncbi:MAG: hypothetical protein SV422_02990 [Pseudomonadota bacterium]|nr:hypothetical protein [Pseudomonadota bacterium]